MGEDLERARRGRRLRAGALLLAAILSLVAGASIIAFRYARAATRSLAFPRRHVTAADRRAAEASLGPLEDVALHTEDGLVLRGWYAPSKNRAAIVFVHGGSGNRMQLLPEAAAVAKRGFGVLVYDSRASGESDGELVTWGATERRDLRAAVDFLVARHDVDPKRVGAHGLSIGASTVALGASEDPRIGAVLLNATWTSLEDEVRWKFGKFGALSTAAALHAFREAGIDPGQVRPIDEIARVAPRPLFIATGDRDTDTPVTAMQRLFDAAGAPKEMWIVPGAEHGGYADVSAEYTARVAAFFERSLAAR